MSHPQMPYHLTVVPSFSFTSLCYQSSLCRHIQDWKQSITMAGGNTLKGPMILTSSLGIDERVGAWDLRPPLLNHAMSFANYARD